MEPFSENIFNEQPLNEEITDNSLANNSCQASNTEKEGYSSIFFLEPVEPISLENITSYPLEFGGLFADFKSNNNSVESKGEIDGLLWQSIVINPLNISQGSQKKVFDDLIAPDKEQLSVENQSEIFPINSEPSFLDCPQLNDNYFLNIENFFARLERGNNNSLLDSDFSFKKNYSFINSFQADNNSSITKQNLSIQKLADLALNLALKKLDIYNNQSSENLIELQTIFGDNWRLAEAQTIIQQLVTGQSDLKFELLDGRKLRANGAFSQETNTIYLSKSFVKKNLDNPEIITNAIIEELGHYLDSRLNVSDSVGDEGELFAAIILGKNLTQEELQQIKTENDLAILNINEDKILIEQSALIEPNLNNILIAQLETNPTPLTLGQTITTTIPNTKYSFNLTENSFLYFDALTNNNNYKWTLKKDNNPVISQRAFTATDGNNIANPILALNAGNYLLEIEGITNSNTTASFRLINLKDATNITPGTIVNSQLSPFNETDVYKFNGVAGDKFFLDFIGLNYPSTNPTWSLIDPLGNLVFDFPFNADIANIQLPETGTYTLLIEGNISETNNGNNYYSFNLFPIQTNPTPLTLGQTITTTIPNTKYSFNLSENSFLYFDALTNNIAVLI